MTESRSPIAAFRSQPWLINLMFGAGLLSYLIGGQVLGYNFQGWMWIFILVASVAVLVQRLGRITFPCLLWAPWTLWVVWGAFSGYEYAYQSTVQILCPLVAGMAVSSLSIGPEALKRFPAYLGWVFIGFLFIFLVFVLPWTLRDIDNSGFANGSINALFFQAFFLCAWFLGGRKWQSLWKYVAAAAIPLLSGNRGPLLAGFGLVLCVVAPLSLRTRLFIAVAGVVLGVAMFYTPKIQKKMFFSGHGEISDLRQDNPDLRTNGRGAMWEAMEKGIQANPWWGHGGNADRTYLLSRGFVQYLPHNDWLRIRFNYGNFGALLYAGTILIQMGLAYRRSRRASLPVRLLFCAAASCFVPYMIVMYTDNVLIYCQYFTVPHFALLGYAYAAGRQDAGLSNGVRRRLVLRPVSAGGASAGTPHSPAENRCGKPHPTQKRCQTM